MSKVKKDSLGDRMKTYESVSRTFLTRRTPVIIRLDGSHFHTFTKGFDKPYDTILNRAMQSTMQYLCEKVQNCVLGYTQSDEITLVLCDYKTITTSAWFDNNVQKICSTAAALASVYFNNVFSEIVEKEYHLNNVSSKLYSTYTGAIISKPSFDARAFNLPKEEVCNCLIWRQQDAIRNSIQGLGQANFSHKELQGKSCANIKEMLLNIGEDWDKLPLKWQRGVCCIKSPTGRGWILDEGIPLFTEDRDYVNSRLTFEEVEVKVTELDLHTIGMIMKTLYESCGSYITMNKDEKSWEDIKPYIEEVVKEEESEDTYSFYFAELLNLICEDNCIELTTYEERTLYKSLGEEMSILSFILSTTKDTMPCLNIIYRDLF